MNRDAVVNTWVHGVSGRMGAAVSAAVGPMVHSYHLAGGSDRAQLFFGGERRDYHTPAELGQVLDQEKISMVFDFSSSDGNQILFEALSTKPQIRNILIGTTGLKVNMLSKWQNLCEANDLRCLIAPNTSIGILALTQASRLLRKLLEPRGFDIELSETHHRHKVDAPSGTALFVANSISKALPKPLTLISDRNQKRKEGELGIHAIRGGSVFGIHEVMFFGEHEQITISHTAYSRELFANGAAVLGRWLQQQTSGFYTLEDVDLDNFRS